MIEQFLDCLDFLPIRKLLNDELTKDISIEDIDKAISSLKAGKSLGANGFLAEWHKSMRVRSSKKVTPLLWECLKHILKEGILPPSWKKAIIRARAPNGAMTLLDLLGLLLFSSSDFDRLFGGLGIYEKSRIFA